MILKTENRNIWKFSLINIDRNYKWGIAGKRMELFVEFKKIIVPTQKLFLFILHIKNEFKI